MTAREEKKERRQHEREAAERAARRKRVLAVAAGATLAVAAIAIAAALFLADGGSDDAADGRSLASAAEAAGCRLRTDREAGRDHTGSRVRYQTNPPTSGPHNPVAAQDGTYAPGNEPEQENAVHSLEHGRVLLQYRPGTPAGDVQKLRALADEELNGSAGYHVLLFQNNSGMPDPIAAVAWTRALSCGKLNPEAVDVIRRFRAAFTDKGPEFIP